MSQVPQPKSSLFMVVVGNRGEIGAKTGTTKIGDC
jgi:hypothetical protein